MVSIDTGAALESSRFDTRLPGFSLAGLACVAASALVMTAIATHGFNDNGLRLGTQMAWRFASVLLFVAIVAGPLARFLPFLHGLRSYRRQLIWSFCAGFAVYLASILAPNLLRHEGLTPGMTVYLAFGGLLTATVALTASRPAATLLGDPARRAILGVGITYFWLAYALEGLAHLSGPHRPDSFYGFSVCMMVLALLLRFADRLAVKLKARFGAV